MSNPKSSYKDNCVQWYIDHGWTLFPLNGKHPPKDCHWNKVTFDPFFQPGANFGVQLGSDDLVVDIDPRNGGELSKLPFLLPDTIKVVTGSGGTHLYFKKPANWKTRKNIKELPGFDFITEGGYVVGAGCLHPDTQQPYKFGGSTAHVPAQAPQVLLDLIHKTAVALTQGVKNAQDDEQTKQRYIDYLKDAPIAIEGSNGDGTTFTVAATGRDFGLSSIATFDLLLRFYNPNCLPPWAENDLQRKVENAYAYASNSPGALSPIAANFPKVIEPKKNSPNDHKTLDGVYSSKQEIDEEIDKWLQLTKGRGRKNNLNNAAVCFSRNFPNPLLQGLLCFNEFSMNIEFTRPAPWHKGRIKKVWDDEDAIQCKFMMSNRWHFEPNTQIVHEAALKASRDQCYHPVKDYYAGLQWDGHKRIHQWMHNFLGAEDNDYTRAVGIKTLVACVKRIYEPGCKFDYITVLEGKQDTGKSTAWKVLASKDFFGDTPIDITKEWSILKTLGKLMYEWAEMETFRKATNQAMKAFLSSDTDTVRLPYARMAGPIPRQGIFVGSFNPESDKDIGWLHDTTGNRRYWIVATSVEKPIDIPSLSAVREQLWAEAIELYHQGYPIYFDDMKVLLMAQAEQAARLGKDPWFDPIKSWLDATGNLTRDIFTGDDIFKDCIGGNLTQYKRPEMTRVAHVMGQLGWRKGSHYHPILKKPVTGYRRPSLVLE